MLTNREQGKAFGLRLYKEEEKCVLRAKNTAVFILERLCFIV